MTIIIFLVVVAGLLVSAARSEGRPGTAATTNDGGAWLLNRERSAVGHVNRQVREISAAVRVAEPGEIFEVDQAGDVLFVHNQSLNRVDVFDQRTHQSRGSLDVPPEVNLVATDDGVVVFATMPLSVWILTEDQLVEAGKLTDIEPNHSSTGAGRVVVTPDGRVVVHDVDANAVLWLPGDGSQKWTQLGGVTQAISPEVDAHFGLTTTGSMAVVWSEEEATVITPDGPQTIPLDPPAAAFQQPSSNSEPVHYLGVDGRIVTISADLRLTVSEHRLAAAGPLAPIFHDGCLFAVATTPPTFARICDDSLDEKPLSGAGAELRLRLVNGWVWINDVDSGLSWTTSSSSSLDRVDDWGEALADRDEKTTDTSLNTPAEPTETRLAPDADGAELERADDLDLEGENLPPVAQDDTASTRTDRPVLINVLENDHDPNGDPLLVESVELAQSADAQASLSTDHATVQISPRAGFTGRLSFTYVVSDGRGGRDSASGTLEVVPAVADSNSPPTAVTDVAAGRAGTPLSLNVLENDTDPEGDSITLTAFTAETGAVVFAPDGQVTYTPDRTETAATTSLTYVVTDEFGASTDGKLTVRLRLADTNSAPDARNDTGVTTAGAAVVLNLLDNDDDPDNDRLIAARQPRLIRAPSDRVPGLDSPTEGASTKGTGAESMAAAVTADGDFFFIPPSAGTFVFDYLVSDGQMTDTALVRIDAEAPGENDPPIAVRDDITIARGTTRLVSVLDNDGDPDGDVVGIVDWSGTRGLEIAEQPGIGFLVTVRNDAPNAAIFQYSISDGRSEPVAASVVVAITEPPVRNLPPVVRDDQIDARRGRMVTIPVLLNDLDPEGELLEVVRASVADDGAATAIPSADGQTVVLTINDQAQTDLAVTYEASDPAGTASVGRIEVRLLDAAAPNRPPVARVDTGRTIDGTSVEIPVLANDSDADGDNLQVESISDQPANGRAELTDDGLVRYVPTSGFSGTDRFSYVVVDTEGGRSVGSIEVGVMPRPPANRAPSARDDAFTVALGGTGIVLDPTTNDSDPDSDQLQLVSATDPSLGDVDISDGTLVFTAPPDDGSASAEVAPTREVTISYRISDGRGGSDDALITITLEPVVTPEPPLAIDDSVGPVRGGQLITVDVLANDTDPDSDPTEMTLSSTSEATAVVNGQLQISVGAESAQFGYTLTDQDGLSDQGIVTVFVVDNAAPEARNLLVKTAFGETVNLTLADQVSDADNDPLFFSCCENTTGGTVEIGESAAGVLDLTFTPDDGFVGDASFSYSVDDQAGHLVSASVTVTVLPPRNRPPIASSLTLDIEAGLTVPFDVATLVDDPDTNDSLSFSYQAAPFVVSSAGSVLTLFAPLSAADETTTIDYTVTDDGGASASGSITITVLELSTPPPSAVADSAQTAQGQDVEIDVVVNDIDPLEQGLEITRIAPSTSGTTAAGDTPGSIRFTPSPETFGRASFSYTITDAAGRPSVGLVTIDIAGRPDEPASPNAEANDGRALITWSTPASNGSAVDSYEIELASDTGASSVVALGLENSYQFSGLTNGVDHRFRIRAHNGAGWSPWGIWSQPVRPDTTPDAPAAPTLEFGNAQLTVSWSPPVNSGSEITAYKLEIGGGTNLVTTVGSGTSHTWQGLTNGVEYQFRLAAVNAAGDSSWSSWSGSEHPLGPPRAAAAPSTVRGNRYLDIDWSTPDDNGDPISGYEIELRNTGSVISVAGAVTNHRWADLDNGVAQEFRIRASNRAVAPGPWSAWSTPLAPCSIPDQVPAPSVTRGDEQVTVSWTVPSDQGCALTGYEVRANATSTRSVSPGETNLVFEGLTNGMSYTFEVRARNTEGDGDWSQLSGAAVPAGPPTVPSITSATPTAVGMIGIDWGGASSNGSPIVGHELSINGGVAFGVSGQGHDASGLANNTTYSFRVRACNAVGCSNWSSSAAAETWGTPSSPQAFALVSGNGEVTLSWSAPADLGGSPLTEYVYRLNGQSTGNWSASATSFLWQPLPNGVAVTAEVRACNVVGCSPFVQASGTPTAPPAAVTISVGGTYAGAGCQGVCHQIAVEGVNFTPNTTANTVCHSTFAGPFSSNNPTPVDGSGSISAVPCFFGFPGETVWVVVDGVTSNSIIWP